MSDTTTIDLAALSVLDADAGWFDLDPRLLAAARATPLGRRMLRRVLAQRLPGLVRRLVTLDAHTRSRLDWLLRAPAPDLAAATLPLGALSLGRAIRATVDGARVVALRATLGTLYDHALACNARPASAAIVDAFERATLDEAAVRDFLAWRGTGELFAYLERIDEALRERACSLRPPRERVPPWQIDSFLDPDRVEAVLRETLQPSIGDSTHGHAGAV